MASLKSARARMEELGYDPIEALVEIARNRNQISELRVRAAIALLPYVYSQVPTKLDVNITEHTGVMMVPVAVTETEWQQQVTKIGKAAMAATSGKVIDVGPDGKPLN